MFRLNDLILLLVIFSSMLTGILFPEPASIFQPYPLFLMMFLLFLSFLPIELNDIRQLIRNNGSTVIWLACFKMILLPIMVYFLFIQVAPAYAIGALLLTGVSTGVVAPFISGLVDADGPLVLVMVVITSFAVPFTLPMLVKILLEQEMTLSLLHMMRMLLLVIVVPVIMGETLKRLWPKIVGGLMKHRYPMSLAVFALINLAVFSKYSAFFYKHPAIIVKAGLAAFALGGIYFLAGLAGLLKSSVKKQLSAVITIGNVNNVLILVFAAEFFGPLEPTLAAIYMVPFFGLILPMRVYARIRD
ncbi:sodium Bile acid symporter family protein [delta proteobacterium NaphS2]|nr:sodium Bile acid symporter family protein [delta proteobacterium NaphS2]